MSDKANAMAGQVWIQCVCVCLCVNKQELIFIEGLIFIGSIISVSHFLVTF